MSFLVRSVQVASVSFLLGGAVLILLLIAFTHLRQQQPATPLIDVMEAYEWGFWFSLGLIAATGVGNLAAYGEALPSAGSNWGSDFVVKMGLALVLLVVSLMRVMSLVLVEMAGSKSLRAMSRVESLYIATAVLVTGVLGLAIALAHF